MLFKAMPSYLISSNKGKACFTFSDLILMLPQRMMGSSVTFVSLLIIDADDILVAFIIIMIHLFLLLLYF